MSFVGRHLDPLGPLVYNVLPCRLLRGEVNWGVADLGPWECVLSLGLVGNCAGVAGLFRKGGGSLKGTGDVTLLCSSGLV